VGPRNHVFDGCPDPLGEAVFWRGAPACRFSSNQKRLLFKGLLNLRGGAKISALSYNEGICPLENIGGFKEGTRGPWPPELAPNKFHERPYRACIMKENF